MSAQYLLSNTAHICVLPTGVVVLDVASGRYFALSAEQANAAAAHVKGWPAMTPAGDEDRRPEAALQPLLQRRLITADAARGKIASQVRIDNPIDWIGEFRPGGWPQVKAHHVVRFARAVLVAALSLKTRKLQAIVARIARRKQACRGIGTVNAQQLAELVRVFDWLRPLAFHRRDTCLLYALAMLEFLASYQVFPDWIFGVSAAPFKAHCWLQQDRLVLTDTPFGASVTTAIMVV